MKQLCTALRVPNCLKHQAGWQPFGGLLQTGQKSIPGLPEGGRKFARLGSLAALVLGPNEAMKHLNPRWVLTHGCRTKCLQRALCRDPLGGASCAKERFPQNICRESLCRGPLGRASCAKVGYNHDSSLLTAHGLARLICAHFAFFPGRTGVQAHTPQKHHGAADRGPKRDSGGLPGSEGSFSGAPAH